MSASSSTTLAVQGNSSLTQVPFLPCRANLYLDGASATPGRRCPGRGRRGRRSGGGSSGRGGRRAGSSSLAPWVSGASQMRLTLLRRVAKRSTLRQHLVQVQDQVGDHRVRRQLAG